MGKIKLKLTSGSELEKPIISAFEAENNTYVVFDNESTGSMGLPIILVSKVIDDKAIKIIDPAEWTKVKEYLKNIIAGSTVKYIKTKEELAADEVYYTQLTLPIASFDALKNNYKPEDVVPAAPVVPVAPAVPEVDIKLPDTPAPEPISVAPVPEPVAVPTPEPVAVPAPEPVAVPVPEQVAAPVIEPAVVPEPIVAPVIEPVVVPETTVTAVESAPVAPIAPIIPEAPVQVTITPIVDSKPEPVVVEEVKTEDNINYEEMKATFMKSCENMFDALISKLKK